MSLACILRWGLNGVRTSGGEVVRLEMVRLGGRWLTSREALQRFADRQTPRFGGAPSSATGDGANAAERAGAELEKVGI